MSYQFRGCSKQLPDIPTPSSKNDPEPTSESHDTWKTIKRFSIYTIKLRVKRKLYAHYSTINPLVPSGCKQAVMSMDDWWIGITMAPLVHKQCIFSKYKMEQIITNDYVCFRINKGIYGLKQAVILAYTQVKEHLAPHRYYPIPNTVGMWKHKTRPIQFCLCRWFWYKIYHQERYTVSVRNSTTKIYSYNRLEWDKLLRTYHTVGLS